MIKQKSFAPFVLYPCVKSRSTVGMHVQILRGSHSKVLSATESADLFVKIRNSNLLKIPIGITKCFSIRLKRINYIKLTMHTQFIL